MICSVMFPDGRFVQIRRKYSGALAHHESKTLTPHKFNRFRIKTVLQE